MVTVLKIAAYLGLGALGLAVAVAAPPAQAVSSTIRWYDVQEKAPEFDPPSEGTRNPSRLVEHRNLGSNP